MKEHPGRKPEKAFKPLPCLAMYDGLVSPACERFSRVESFIRWHCRSKSWQKDTSVCLAAVCCWRRCRLLSIPCACYHRDTLRDIYVVYYRSSELPSLQECERAYRARSAERFQFDHESVWSRPVGYIGFKGAEKKQGTGIERALRAIETQ